jgi:hypothetical protein
MGLPIAFYLSGNRRLHFCEDHKNSSDRPWDPKHPEEVRKVILEALSKLDEPEIKIEQLGPGKDLEWVEAVHWLEFNYGCAFKQEKQWKTECGTCWELELCCSKPFLLGLLLVKKQEWFARCLVGLSKSPEHEWELVKEVCERLAATLEQPES